MTINNIAQNNHSYSLITWQHSVAVGTLALINVVKRHWARLILGWVTVCGRVNHLGM